MTGKATAPFHERLLAWWDSHGRKDLPWQDPRTPYRVWISEIMLQQTQVATVIPYFQRWMDDFPDIGALASAPLDEVLSHWAGLGYYARARNLHKAAKRCVELHGGALPTTADALVDLPGIGLSTANAIVSQSTGEPAAVLDGNVRRVLARHAAVAGYTGKSSVQKELWREAESRLPSGRGDDYTQAVMDLGALVCTRSSPACARCPVAGDCRALRQDRVAELPSPKPTARVRDMKVFMLLATDTEGRILLEKRPAAGIWGGLWCLPAGPDINSIGITLGIALKEVTRLPPFEHRLSHVQMNIHPFVATAGDALQVKCLPRHRWFDPEQRSNVGVPKPVQDLLTSWTNGELK